MGSHRIGRGNAARATAGFRGEGRDKHSKRPTPAMRKEVPSQSLDGVYETMDFSLCVA